jgi:hypothetical protein
MAQAAKRIHSCTFDAAYLYKTFKYNFFQITLYLNPEVSFMKKKAQNLSMNVIIIAALALLVLVILSVIFMNRSGQFVIDSKKCEASGGVCVNTGQSCPAGMSVAPMSGLKCLNSDGSENPNRQCCITGGG